MGDWLNNETIHSLASSRNYAGDDAIDNVDNYVKEWWRVSDKLYSPIIYDPISKIYYKQELNMHVGIVLNAQQQFVNKLIKQRDDYKTQRNSLIDDLSWYKAKFSMLEDESSKYIDLLEEFSQHIGNEPSSSTYKYFRAKLDNLNITEDKQNG